jgi:purine-nucleoside phosphorylase
MELVDKVIKKIKKEIGDFRPEIALFLGSGLSDACPDMKIYKEIDYNKLGIKKLNVKGHVNKFIFGEYKGIKIVKLSRFHFYESGDTKKVSFPYEIISKLGVKDVIITGATGGVSDRLKVGDIVLIKDHISFAPNPLIGRKDQYFVDMDDAYNSVYRNIVKEIAMEEKIDIVEGIQAQNTGPTYETKTETDMLRLLNVDVVSMSLAQDVILCRFFGINVLSFAIVANIAGRKTSHDEVLIMSQAVAPKLKIILSKFLDNQLNNKKK